MHTAQLTQQGTRWQLSGHLDSSSVTALLGQWQQLIQDKFPTQLDLSALKRCDSAGLACLLQCQQQAQQRDQVLSLQNPPQQLQQLAQLYGLETNLFAL